MYTRRRILAVLAVLLVLALLVPKACQALMGSNDDPGPNGEQQAGAAGTDTGADTESGEESGAGNADTDDADTGDTGTTNKGDDEAEAKDKSSSRGAPFVDDGPGGENGSGAGAGEEAAPDLLALVTPLAAVSDEEPTAGDQSAGGGAPSPSEAGGSPSAEEQPISEIQFALAASPAPAQQPSSEGERAPTRRSRPAEVEPAAIPRNERIRDRAGRLPGTPVAEPAAIYEAGARQTVVEPAAAETFAHAPVAAEPVAVAPAPVPVPAPPAAVAAPVPAAAVPSDPAFAPTPAGGVLNGAPAVPAAGAALPAGPRLAGPGPTGTPGRAVF